MHLVHNKLIWQNMANQTKKHLRLKPNPRGRFLGVSFPPPPSNLPAYGLNLWREPSQRAPSSRITLLFITVFLDFLARQMSDRTLDYVTAVTRDRAGVKCRAKEISYIMYIMIICSSLPSLGPPFTGNGRKSLVRPFDLVCERTANWPPRVFYHLGKWKCVYARAFHCLQCSHARVVTGSFFSIVPWNVSNESIPENTRERRKRRLFVLCILFQSKIPGKRQLAQALG